MAAALYDHALVVAAFNYATLTTGTNTGVTIDTNPLGNAFRDVLIAMTVGTVTNGTFVTTLFESDASNFSGPTAVDAGRVVGTLPSFDSTTDETIYYFGCKPTKRYVRATVTVTSGAAGGPVAAVAVLADGSTAPPRRV